MAGGGVTMMSEVVQFVCDYHDADFDANSITEESEAYEQGWAVFERRWWGEKVFPAIGSIPELRFSARWHVDKRHICPHCLRDPECRAWLIGWTVGPTTDDRRNVEAADAELAA